MHRVAWEGADWGVSSRGAILVASPDVPLDPPPWWATRKCLTACRRPHTDDSLQPVTGRGAQPPHTQASALLGAGSGAGSHGRNKKYTGSLGIPGGLNAEPPSGEVTGSQTDSC